jgi:hypothetical protein
VGPLIISNIPSLPLFSPDLSNTLNQNIDDDVVMNITDFSSTPNVHLPNVPCVKKKNYDAKRKFKESWAVKLPWEEFCLGSMATYTLLSVGFGMRWKGRIKSWLLSGILFISMQINIKL